MSEQTIEGQVADIAKARNDARELAWDLLRMGCGGLDTEHGWILDHMCNSTYEEGCEYFEELGWLEKIGHRTYKDIKKKGGRDGDGI